MAVVGAGPAGCAAAITAARLGLKVAVVDKAVFPRDKCCGDGLTVGALRGLEALGLDPAMVDSWEEVSEVVVTPAGGRPLTMPLPSRGLFAASARRYHLDAALVDLARRAGVGVVEGDGVAGVGLSGEGGDVEVRLAVGDTIRARYVIAADGMWSPVRRLLGLTEPGYLGEWQAGRQYFANAGPDSRKLWVWFEPDMLPGYAWSFPLADGTVNLGYGVLRGSARGDLRGQQIDWSQRPHIARVLGAEAKPVGPWRAWPIPARIGRAPLSALDGRVLFAGDAAGACDVMTGEGIAQAIDTGRLAARAAVQAGPDRPQAASARYRRQLRWGMGVDDRLAQMLSAVLARPGGSARALGLLEGGDWRRRTFARWMFEDCPKAVLATPHRWHRQVFTGPGAWFP